MESTQGAPALPSRLGRYRLDPGSASFGATGIVLRGEDVGDGRVVAVKVPNERAPGPRTESRFAREARIAGDAGSPYVAGIVDRGIEDGFPYLVMEWVPQTVDEVIASGGRFEERVALRVMLQVAEALARLHERRIVHRDISPRNIGLTDQLEARLLDFGIAASAAEHGSASTAELGTPAFSAPERLGETRHDDDPRIDLYGLGGVGFLMLTGIAPYEGTRSQVVRRHQAGERPDLDLVPARLRPMLSRLLAERAEDRYQSATALVEDLRALLGMSSTASVPIAGRSQRSGMRAALLPVFGIGAAAVLAMFVLAQSGGTETPVAGPEPTPAATAVPIALPDPPGPISEWGRIAVPPPAEAPMYLASTERHLYVAQNGGDLTDDTITVWNGAIFGNGGVGPWVEQARIQTGRSAFPTRYQLAGMVIWEQCMFVLPGDTNSDPVSDEQMIEVARIEPGSGNLSAFEPAEPLTSRRAGAALLAAAGRLYAIGGFQFTESEDRRSVEFAEIGPDCELSPWTLTEPLQLPTAAPRAATDGRHIWVVGGHPGDSGAVPTAEVQRTSINPDGTLTSWTTEPAERLLTPRFDHGLAFLDGHLIAAGGNIQAVGTDPTIYTETVEYAAVRADGSLEPWSASPSFPEPRGGHGMTATDGELLVIGGVIGRHTPQVARAERGLTTNLAIALPDEPPASVIDDELPAIVSMNCAPEEARTGDTITCVARTAGTVRSTEWATSSLTAEGPTFSFEVWAPLTQLVSLEVCNTLGCAFGDQVAFVTADEQFWETDEIRHPESLPATGGEFKVSTVAGTQDLDFGADVVFRITGPAFDETVVAGLCAAARASWGISICYDALFEIPSNTTGTVQTYMIQASAPTLAGVLTSSFRVADD